MALMMVGQCIAMGNYIFGWKLPCPHPDTAPPPPPPPPPPPAAAVASSSPHLLSRSVCAHFYMSPRP